MNTNGQLNPIVILPPLGLAIIGSITFDATGAAIGFGIGLIVSFFALR